MIHNGFVALLADPELRNHRQVHKRECHQRTKVNQRRGGDQIEINRQQGNGADQQHVERRGAPCRMDIAEEAFREHAITAHHIHQAGNARVGCHTGGQHGDAGENQRAKLERPACHLQHDFRL